MFTSLIISIVLGIIAIVLVALFANKLSKNVNRIIQVVLFACIAFFCYKLWMSIDEPVKFEKVKEERYSKVVGQLALLRDAQVAHKTVTGVYTNDINKLAEFVETAKFALTQKRDVQVVDEERNRRFGVSGYMKEVTIVDTLGFRSVKDSLFKKINVRDLLNYNFEGATGKIKMETGTFYDDDAEISTFKATASKSDILADQPKKLVKAELKVKAVEAIDGPAITVGDLDEISTAGNWPRKYATAEKN
ncbi:MAG: hypothetical protein NWQ09_11080 [Nonlabens sp.]|nr:hypothetical protein [Nonlabens sp.]MDP5101862.1 hypothetical protein [Nonlabens sp.]